jgi:hypothetical protein
VQYCARDWGASVRCRNCPYARFFYRDAWAQWTTARSKLILDLYEHRRKVYSDFHGPIGQAMRDGRSDLNNYVDYIRVVDQAQFLFGRDVRDFIEDMRHTLNQLGYASSMLRGAKLVGDDLRRHLKIQNDCMMQIAEFWKRLDKLMVPYMLMEQKRPWSVSRVTGYVGHLGRKGTKAIERRRRPRKTG